MATQYLCLKDHVLRLKIHSPSALLPPFDSVDISMELLNEIFRFDSFSSLPLVEAGSNEIDGVSAPSPPAVFFSFCSKIKKSKKIKFRKGKQ